MKTYENISQYQNKEHYITTNNWHTRKYVNKSDIYLSL